MATFIRCRIDAFWQRTRGEHETSTHLLLACSFSFPCSMLLLPIALVAAHVAGLPAKFVFGA
ncbi:MAG: hypothetical protein P8J59_04400 [Phycisphaerales bacterium]|nr:hypothetical protein [Phycisphaerales bacterium]